MADSSRKPHDTNSDPLTGEPGSHPVGTGIGAASGGATGAAVGAIAGPIGAAIGAVVGAVAGGLAGKGVAEAIDPTAEDAYWRENHGQQPFVREGHHYDDFAPAYRAGYEGYAQHGTGGKQFEDAEPTLRENYESWRQRRPSSLMDGAKPATPLAWDEVKPAARAAWERVDRARTVRASEAAVESRGLTREV